ncbi:hypothetical protein SAMN06298216_0573 [Spirosomataceae bacterium TFI 002]|nr:hypothetical protein SAMN06298216_0573 [Spirosomataceae bacterium TFI 002]
MKTTIKAVAFLLLSSTIIQAQGFLSGFDRFSKKKPAYVTLQNGEEIEGEINDLDRRKGLIEEITLEIGKKKKTFKSSEIKSMYLPASGLSKLNNQMDVATKLDKWDNRSVNLGHINEGYALFELTEVQIKKNTEMLLMQLVNPTSCSKLRVYFDPWAPQTMGVGIGGMTVAGGLDKSYYVSLPNKAAFKLQKKNYVESLPIIFEGCESLIKEAAEEDKWKELATHVETYDKCE